MQNKGHQQRSSVHSWIDQSQIIIDPPECYLGLFPNPNWYDISPIHSQYNYLYAIVSYSPAVWLVISHSIAGNLS